MYHYLRDYCAFIFTGITLYDGLAINKGVVAVYGKGDFAHSLHMHTTEQTQYFLDSLDRKGTTCGMKNNERSNPIREPIHGCICTSTASGIKGLEDFLFSKGFKVSDHKFEKIAANQYIEKSKKKISRPRMTLFTNKKLEHTLEMGREIAAAVTVGQVRLSGQFSSASSKNNKARHNVEMSSPLKLGNIHIRSMVTFEKYKLGLVYINGQFRVITTTPIPIKPFNKPIWDITPKLDTAENNGLMKRIDMDTLIYYLYEHKNAAVTMNSYQDVLLGRWIFEEISSRKKMKSKLVMILR